jgi:DNA-directed RNA polymerase subunit L
MFRNYSYDPKDPSDKHSFEVYDVDVSVVNGIRRTILTDIPVVGIIGDHVQVIKNNGPLHNEIISHRIGLLPVGLTEDETENYQDDSIELELNVLNEGNAMQKVSTADIKGKKDDKELSKKELEKLFPAHQVTKSHILITRLRTGEQLHFKASLVKDTARHNAAFSPVSLCNFFYIQDPSLAKKKESVLDKERAYYTNKYGDANVMKFEIEPINKLMTPKYMVNKALDIIIDRLNNTIATITSEDFTPQAFQDLKSTFDFTFQNEDDTLGNIIMSHIHNKYVREEKTAMDNIYCTYVGYICPHPLKTEMILRITLEDQINPATFIRFLESNCRTIIDELTNMKKEWNSFAK